MRTWPETPYYTPRPGQHPARPWWRQCSELGFNAWIRLDGRAVRQLPGLCWSSPEPSWFAGDEEGRYDVRPPGGDLNLLLTQIDKTHPLPPPLLCPGQVWLMGDGRACVYNEASPGIRWRPFRSTPVTDMLNMTESDHRTYLLWDPCTPSQAPWAPPETA